MCQTAWAALLSLALCLLPASQAGASEALWSLGLRTKGTLDFKPGQDLFTGPEVAYSNFNLAGHSLQIKAAYLTSRMEQAFRENILKYDVFLVSPLWHFRRNSIFDPTMQLDLGYARFDTEYKEFDYMDNDTWLAAFQPGLNLNFAQGRYGLHWHFGYDFITPEGHILTPGTYGLNIWMML